MQFLIYTVNTGSIISIVNGAEEDKEFFTELREYGIMEVA